MKKINLFGKQIPILLLVILVAVGIGSAALVTYLSSTVTGAVNVGSPMQITIDGISNGGSFDADIFSVDLYGGESFAIDTTTTNLANVAITAILVEVKVTGFDGLGITYLHSDCQEPEVNGVDCWEGNIPVCIDGTDAYYYIGPAGGFDAGVGYNMEATSTITADQALTPATYNAEIKIIPASKRVC